MSRRRTSPSDMRREARRLPLRIQVVAVERQDAWTETERPDDIAALTTNLDVLYIKKRDAEKGEGAPFEGRPIGKTEAGEVFTARVTRKREGEINPVLLKRRTG